MVARVDIACDLDASRATLMGALRRVDTLVTVTRGLLAFDAADGRLPENWPTDGSPVSLRVRPFGLPIGWTHEIRIVEVDDDRGLLRSEEHGGPIRRWEHVIQVVPITDGRSRYRDVVTIDAGLLTLPVAGWAALFYRVRQRRWRRLAPTLSRCARSADH
jgi:ligand-binding SRPBCC domain-containing protein